MDNTYGAPRITAELNDGVPEQERVNHKRVARVMRAAKIAGYRCRRRVKTTTPDPANQKVPDLLNRYFTAVAPNEKYVETSPTCPWRPVESVSRDGDRLLLRSGRRVGDR